jgi:hypothetical protein
MVDPNKSNTHRYYSQYRTGIERALAGPPTSGLDAPRLKNTNTVFHRQKQRATPAAAQQRRPVHFVVYHANSSTAVKAQQR